MTTALKPKRESHNIAERPNKKVPSQPKADARPIWETVAEIGAQISDKDWERVPNDSSINFKNYLYGAPAKRLPSDKEFGRKP